MLRQNEKRVHRRLFTPWPAHGNRPIAYFGSILDQQILFGPAGPRVDRIVNDLAAHLLSIHVSQSLYIVKLYLMRFYWHLSLAICLSAAQRLSEKSDHPYITEMGGEKAPGIAIASERR